MSVPWKNLEKHRKASKIASTSTSLESQTPICLENIREPHHIIAKNTSDTYQTRFTSCSSIDIEFRHAKRRRRPKNITPHLSWTTHHTRSPIYKDVIKRKIRELLSNQSSLRNSKGDSRDQVHKRSSNTLEDSIIYFLSNRP